MAKVRAPDRFVRITTTTGMGVSLAPNEVKEIPDVFLSQALADGCIHMDAEHPPMPEIDQGTTMNLMSVLVDMADRGDPKEFTKNGTPRLAVVRRLCGYDVPSDEVTEAWAAVIDGEGR